MADEINGISAYLMMLVDDEYVFIGGQRSHSHNVVTAPIMITNQSAGESDRVLDGDGHISESISMEVVFSSDAAFMAIRDAAASRLVHSFKTIKPNLSEEPLVGMVINYTEAPASGTALAASFSIKIATSSADAPEYTNKTFGGGVENGGNPNYGSGGGGAGGGAGGGIGYSFYTALYQNNCIDFWRLDERVGTKASNTGKGASGFTKEPLYYNSVVDSSWLADSSINSQLGDSKNLAGLEERSLAGQTSQTGTVFTRSNVWGIEFALEFNNNLAAVDDVVLSFWDDDATTTDGVDKLFRLQVDSANADVLNFVMYTTDDNVAFTKRTFIVAASIAALDSGFSYYSIFFESGVSFVVRINNVEIINEDASGWEANLGTTHTTAQLRVGALKDDPTANTFDGKIDVISTYAAQSGILYSAENAYTWWATTTSTSPEVPAEGDDYEELVAALAPIHWWKLDEVTGTAATDDGSNADDLVYITDASTAGYDIAPSSAFTSGSGRAKLIDDGAERIEGASDSVGQLLAATDYTIEFAVKLPAEGTQFVMGYTDDGASNNGQYKIQFIDPGTQNLTFTMIDGVGGETAFIIATDFTDHVGLWTYISIAYDATAETVDTRINGIDESNLDVSTGTINSAPVTGGLHTIGAFPNGSGVAKNGIEIDEPKIYNKILTDQQRDDVYSYWKFGTLTPNSGIGATQAAAIANAYPIAIELGNNSDVILSVPAGQYAAWPLAASVLASSSNLADVGASMTGSGVTVTVEIWADVGAGVVLQVSGTVDVTAGSGSDVFFDASTYITGYVVINNGDGVSNSLQANILED